MAPVVQTALRAEPSVEPADSFATDILEGLSAKPKRLPPKYFYDLAGSALFERITHVPEYYPTRCEIALLRQHAPAIASLFPPNCALIEFGAGSSRKARILLGAAATIEAYVPVDISGDFLQGEAAQLRRDFPRLAVHPVVADFTRAFEIPAPIAALPRVGFFPGSTIGNFEPHEAAKFLRHAADTLGAGAILVIGVDLIKDIKIFVPPITMPKVSPRSSISISWRASIASSAQISISPPSSITPATTVSRSGSRCISPAPSGRR